MSLEAHLKAPQAKGHVSVAQIRDHWYVACLSSELGKKPLARVIAGVPLVVFRTQGGQPGALLDRCPHRNVPLSVGEVAGERLRCGYHGWEFDVGGTCRLIPGLCSEPEGKGRRVESYAAREQDGLVWVYLTEGVTPSKEPFALPLAREAAYTTVWREVQAESSVHAAIENALDVPHTAFLHKGFFRGVGEPHEIEVVVRREADRVEAEYVGEPRPEGLAGKLMSPSGGVVTHFDRFVLPSIAQVEYRIGEENHILVTTMCTPVSDFFTRLYAVISLRLRIPGFLVKPILTPLALKIFSQDAEILKLQTETIQTFGGEQFVSTELDVLGPHIWRLMRQAERGESPEVEGVLVEKRFKMKV
jgi:phenylpropionate dioxygenase-like ring-hydroxylating dioxygenase large terminal subunit